MPTIQPIDFVSTALAFYATVIDNFLTPAEYEHPRDLAAFTGLTRSIHTNFRNSDQVLKTDVETADIIYERLSPLVPELHLLGPENGSRRSQRRIDEILESKQYKHFLDVDGVASGVDRVLVFQRRMLVHSGEEVAEGIKYTMRSDLMYEQV
ncbi:hypothetical protein DFH08DRAFT_799201 [Mycena albidolilacea]|uniref:Uncharacterized protein n=1 Tax=Mycena albidolilacea TaxID=1033008 RepID=A0AAD7AQI4_9AGAR|nr:hypothetical protein DFH08DRAFT_799201 [Mycena albidolilacea]